MSLSTDDERRAFSLWLRTGRRLVVQPGGPVQVKYNHWHDPRDGRFTHSGTGQHDGSWGGGGFTGGGGGSFGGAGASGTWGEPPPKRRKPQRISHAASPRKPINSSASVSVVHSDRPALRRISRNGYHFDVDAYGRTKDIQGTISRSAPNARSRTMQRRAGLPDRRPNDDGGHFIAPRFNGPAEAFNHFAQDANFNRGAYRALEDQWDKAAGAGKKVDVRIMVFYEGQSKRPAQIVVSYAINGEVRRRTFPNERQEKLNAKR